MASNNACLDLLYCAICANLFARLVSRPRVVQAPPQTIYVQQVPANTYASYHDSISAAATGGATADLPLIACARMCRDEESVAIADPDDTEYA
jgi:hypothetical protein